MLRLFKRKAIAWLACTLLLAILLLTPSCRKGFKDYYDEKNTKGGFLYDKLKSDSSFSNDGFWANESNVINNKGIRERYLMF